MRFFAKRRFVALVALLALIVPAAALASEHEDEDTAEAEASATRFDAVVDASYDDVLRLLLFAINSSAAEQMIDCDVPDGVTLERAVDPDTGDIAITVTAGEWDIPEGCTIVDVEGPNGQVNHGQVVSSFVHALKALDRSAIGVPFGQLVRQIAGSDLGKDDQQVRVDDDISDDADADDDEGPKGPPPHANNDKDKKSKSNGNNNGNGPNK